MAAGCEVTDIGEVPTPLLYYSVQHLDADGGVMITGSHNPAEYNGFKIVAGAGTIHGEEIQEVRRMIEAGDFDDGRGKRPGVRHRHSVCGGDFQSVQFSRRIKVVIDAGNGAAGPAMHRVLGS